MNKSSSAIVFIAKHLNRYNFSRLKHLTDEVSQRMRSIAKLKMVAQSPLIELLTPDTPSPAIIASTIVLTFFLTLQDWGTTIPYPTNKINFLPETTRAKEHTVTVTYITKIQHSK